MIQATVIACGFFAAGLTAGDRIVVGQENADQPAAAPSADALVNQARRAVEEQSGPVNLRDEQIALADLQILLRPLTAHQLELEAKAWRDLLQRKTTEMTLVELRSRHAATGESSQDATATTENIVTLRNEQAAVIERFNAVLSAWKAKGGDVGEYEQYAAAVGGLSSVSGDSRVLWNLALSWAKSEEGGIRWLKKAATFLLILLVAWILSRFAGRAVDRAVGRQRRMSNLLKQFLVKTADRVVLIIGLLVGLGAIGMEIGPMLAALGAGSFILAFALQQTLGNLASGLMIMAYRPFDVDDFVDLAGVAGKVRQVSLISTTLLTSDNRLVIIPNNEVWGGTITNATGSDRRRIDLVFGIGYEDDMDQAMSILEQIVAAHPLTLSEPEPTIRVHELADSSINLICRPWATTADYWTVYWDLTREVKLAFDRAGISIPYPQRDVHLHTTSDSTTTSRNVAS